MLHVSGLTGPSSGNIIKCVERLFNAWNLKFETEFNMSVT